MRKKALKQKLADAEANLQLVVDRENRTNRRRRIYDMNQRREALTRTREKATLARQLTQARRDRDLATNTANTAVQMLAHVVEQSGGAVVVPQTMVEQGPPILNTDIVDVANGEAVLFSTRRPEPKPEIEIRIEFDQAHFAAIIEEHVAVIHTML